MAAAFKELFGDQLLTKAGLKPVEEVLAGKKAVGVYFSAHWCPPCRGFTPKLAEMYTSALKAKGLEIVFVSSDRDQSSFDSYYGEQPWVALPYGERDIKAKLSKKYKVQGIPSFVILDPSGGVITKEGRDAVMKDPAGDKFPWLPPSAAEKAKLIVESIGSDLMAKTGGKPIGLYFSGHWCPPCRGFTPKLAEWYNAGLKDKMEIIFVSSDRDEASFNDYFKEMPWLALPYCKREAKEILSDACGVQGIPFFAVINPDGTIITTDGRSKVTSDPKAESFPDGWLPQPFNDVNDDPSALNDEQCVIMLGGSADCEAALKSVAEESYKKAGRDMDSMSLRFYSGKAGGVTEQLRKLTGVVEDKLIMLDIPDDGGFYICDAEKISVDVVNQFISNVSAKKVERKQLQK
jgi:nucleoredoxin